MLSIKNLSKVYAGGKKAVDNMTIDIESGDFIAFIGTSGSGKTTALRMINRMIESTEGEITIDGKNIKELNPVELRRSIGYATYDSEREYCSRTKVIKMVTREKG